MAKTIYTCFPQGKAKALTMSYDDGKRPDEKLIGIFNKYGIKATFNLNYGIMTTEDETTVQHPRIKADKITALYEGHEIATHTLTHPTVARSPLSRVAAEISEDRKGLEELTGRIIRGHAYPNGSYSEEIKQLLKGLGIAYARVATSDPSFSLPTDPYEWKATCHHKDPKLMEYARFFADFQKRQYLKLMYVWGHSYEFVNDDNWNVIEEFCEFMGGRDDIWYATNIEIIDYMEAAKNLQFSYNCDKVYNPSAQSVWLALDDVNIIEVKGGETVTL